MAIGCRKRGLFCKGFVENFPYEASKPNTACVKVRIFYSEAQVPMSKTKEKKEWGARIRFIEGIAVDVLQTLNTNPGSTKSASRAARLSRSNFRSRPISGSRQTAAPIGMALILSHLKNSLLVLHNSEEPRRDLSSVWLRKLGGCIDTFTTRCIDNDLSPSRPKVYSSLNSDPDEQGYVGSDVSLTLKRALLRYSSYLDVESRECPITTQEIRILERALF